VQIINFEDASKQKQQEERIKKGNNKSKKYERKK
jgi:hypothetical protein